MALSRNSHIHTDGIVLTMLVLLSPAKTLDYDSPLSLGDHTSPRFMDESRELIETLRPYSAKRVGKMMSLSDKLAKLNVERYQNWSEPFTPENARQSIMAFKGDVYIGFEAASLNKRDLNFAQKQLRILSGLYGVLRPFDLMQPYRLEMGTDLKNPQGKNLYEFWGDKITQLLNDDARSQKSSAVVNLASKEYFSAVKPDLLEVPLITPVFLDEKNGEYKIISFFAKKARGMMARYIVENRVKTVAGLRKFDMDGYCFDKSRSSKTELYFTRTENWSQVA